MAKGKCFDCKHVIKKKPLPREKAGNDVTNILTKEDMRNKLLSCESYN